MLLLDGNNAVLSSTAIAVPSAANLTLNTSFDPTVGPFRFVVANVGAPALGSIFAGTEVGSATFDANALDPACPAAPSTGRINSQDKSNITAALQSSFNSATPGLLDGSGIPTNGNGATNGAGLTFAPNNLGLAPRLDTTDPFARQFGFTNEQQGILGLVQRRSNKGINFSVDLQQMAAAARKRASENAAALGIRQQSLKDSEVAPRSRWNAWANGRYVDFEDDQTNADRDGHLWWVMSGLSYQLSERTTVGAFSRYREGEVDSTVLNSQLDTDYVGGGVFLATTLGGGLRVIGAALIEQGDSDITIAGATGSFDTDQLTLEARVDKRIHRGKHWIEPAVRILYTDADNDDYTDSTGAFVIGQDLTLGRLTYGPTIGTTLQHGQTQIRPFAKINGVWDFENDGNFTTSTGAVFSTGETAINLGGGVEVVYASGFAVKLAGDWFAFDSDLDGWSVTGGIGAPLSALGLGNVAPGFMSLDFTGQEDDVSAKARLRIPLGKTD